MAGVIDPRPYARTPGRHVWGRHVWGLHVWGLHAWAGRDG